MFASRRWQCWTFVNHLSDYLMGCFGFFGCRNHFGLRWSIDLREDTRSWRMFLIVRLLWDTDLAPITRLRCLFQLSIVFEWGPRPINLEALHNFLRRSILTPQKLSVADRLTEKPWNALPAWCHVAERSLLTHIEDFLGILAWLLLFHLVCDVFYSFDHWIVPLSNASISLLWRVNFFDTLLSFEILEILNRLSACESIIFGPSFLFVYRRFLIFFFVTAKVDLMLFSSWTFPLTQSVATDVRRKFYCRLCPHRLLAQLSVAGSWWWALRSDILLTKSIVNNRWSKCNWPCKTW